MHGRTDVRHLARMVRRHVACRLSPNGRMGETGAVAILVATLLGTGVLLGAAALTMDTGSLLYERSQLQNGADAAALTAAKDCASSAACAPSASAGSALTALAGANAADGTTKISSICGSATAVLSNTGLTSTCSASSGQLVDCPAVSSAFASAPYVEVRTNTLNADGTTVLPPILAQTLAGGYSGETVRACSRVAWLPGGVPPGPVLPVTFSYCEWKAITGANPPLVAGSYVAPPVGAYPGYGVTAPNTAWPAAVNEVTLDTKGSSEPGCPSWNGHVAPGNFGTLDNVSCSPTVVNGWVQGVSGASDPCTTSTLVPDIGAIAYIPIFDCFTNEPYILGANCTDGKNKDWFHISGYAAFYLTGFYFTSSGSAGGSIFPPDNGAQPCSGGSRCVSGWFTTSTLSTTAGPPGPPPFGTYHIQITG
jgi:Flp pilus assembly protein TadG